MRGAKVAPRIFLEKPRRSRWWLVASVALHVLLLLFVLQKVVVEVPAPKPRVTPPPITFVVPDPTPKGGGGGGQPTYIPPPPTPDPAPAPPPTPPVETPKEIPPPEPAPAAPPGPPADGEGPGTGGGTGGGAGGGTGTGNGTGSGPGTGGEGPISPPVWTAGALPLEKPPAELGGKTLEVTFYVKPDGRAERYETEPEINDGGYAAKFRDVMRTFRFKPARKSDGTAVAGTLTISFQIPSR